MYWIGTMTIAAGTSVNNLSTAVPFSIPVGTDSLWVLASGADLFGELKLGTIANSTTAGHGSDLGVARFQVPCVSVRANNVFSAFNNNVASRTVQVMAIYA